MRTVIAALALAGLAGCSGPEVWDGGAGRAAFDRDHAACRTQAMQQLPPAYKQAQAAPVVIVNQRPSGYVTSVPTWEDSPRDLNRGARLTMVDDCLIQKGYTRRR